MNDQSELTGLSELLERLSYDTGEALNHMYDWSEEDFVEFIDRREKYIYEMEAYRTQLNESDKKKISGIMESDTLIKARMNFLKEEVAEQLRQFGGARVQQRGYQNQYTMDGLFIDKKN
ncbi:hypothetical protein ABEW19_00355 [Paenibacillus illinoisensis]|uniref:hypothetical protein n=1 Tax=Paenibacillus illinoisensis TaxID=59845 RepID=UPI003D2C6887